jgi:hypothetical protein
VVARGVDPKDDFVMIGGRNLSDRYYFRKFPDVVGGEEKEKDFVFYFDLEVASHYSPAVTEAYRADLALWHRLSDNFSFEPGIPLSFQLKQLLWSPKFEHMKSLEKSVQSQFLERLYSDLGLLRVLTLTTFKNGNVEHSSAISILRTVKSTIADFLTTPTVRSIYTEQGRSAQNSLLSPSADPNSSLVASPTAYRSATSTALRLRSSVSKSHTVRVSSTRVPLTNRHASRRSFRSSGYPMRSSSHSM